MGAGVPALQSFPVGEPPMLPAEQVLHLFGSVVDSVKSVQSSSELPPHSGEHWSTWVCTSDRVRRRVIERRDLVIFDIK